MASRWSASFSAPARFSLRDIVNSQSAHGLLSWNFFGGFQFVAFFIYLMAAYAETNRAPFDLPEAETELVAGYHTEYSSMKFAMFFMAEYANMITVAASPRCSSSAERPAPSAISSRRLRRRQSFRRILPILWFVVKVFAFLLLYIWVRGTLPRFRYDQLMSFGWKFLLPLAIANIIVTSLVLALREIARCNAALQSTDSSRKLLTCSNVSSDSLKKDSTEHHATCTLHHLRRCWPSQEPSTSCCSAIPSTARSRWSWS